MPYVIQWSDPTLKPDITVQDGAYDQTSTSLTLTGKGLSNYGLYQQENFIQLLENFCNTVPPANPTIGQMWYNVTLGIWYFWNGTGWTNNLLDNFAGPNPPPNAVVGQLWYDTTTKTLNVYGGSGTQGNGWSSAQPQSSAGLGEFGPTPDIGTTGASSRLNRVIGAVQGAGTSAYGWGQTDLIPTFTSTGSLDSASTAAQAHLPNGLTFPSVFDNNAWAIFISRLRQALRQTGLAENQTSPVGFVNDSTPMGGNALANWYNNFDAGPTPHQGTLADIPAGWNGLGSNTVNTYFDNTMTALTQLETYRFSLGAGSTQVTSLVTATRSAPTQSLFIPSGPTAYEHDVTLTFASQAAAEAFFNAGGQVQFNLSFNPSSGSPTVVEQEWHTFLAQYSGMALDYKGMKTTAAYASPSFTPTYLTDHMGGSSITGYYGLTSTMTEIWMRDVLDVGGGGPYSSDPPGNGGLVINASAAQVGGNWVVSFQIQFYLQHTTGDGTSNGLNGVMTSNLTAYSANALNASSPGIALPVAAQSGTFITAA